MPLKLFRRPGSDVWSYRGTVAGDLLRGSTKTANREIAARIAAEIEYQHHKRRLDGPQEVLTFPQAVTLYQKAGKMNAKTEYYLAKIEDHWKNAKVKDMTAGAIRQSAIDLYPKAAGQTWNRQVITPTQAVINHCAELELCPPIRVKRFKFEKKIKKPVMLDWLDTFCTHARPEMVALATFMFATACRISEAKRLEWEDIDFSQRSILIRKTKNKRQRLPHMPPRLLVALANLKGERKGKVFDWSESSLRRFWDEDVETTAKAVEGFKRLTFHSCRHGFATKMLRDGIDPKTAASLGGWESISLFMETYAHAIQDATLTDRLFGTESAREETEDSKNKGLA